ISPLNVGHVMLVPKQHVTSSVQLGASCFARMDLLRQKIALAAERKFGSVLFWEHGIACGASGGCGVSHAHVHFLPMERPLLSELIPKLIERFPDSQSIQFPQLREAVDALTSYLYWSTSSDSGVLERSNSIPSQLMRNIVAEHL